MSFFANIQAFMAGYQSGEYRYNEALMEAMIEQLRAMIADLEEAEATVTSSADTIVNNELLVGETADALHLAMSQTLKTAMVEIKEEAQEQLADIETELNDFREAVRRYKEILG